MTRVTANVVHIDFPKMKKVILVVLYITRAYLYCNQLLLFILLIMSRLVNLQFSTFSLDVKSNHKKRDFYNYPQDKMNEKGESKWSAPNDFYYFFPF